MIALYLNFIPFYISSRYFIILNISLYTEAILKRASRNVSVIS